MLTKTLNAARARELLTYEPATGQFRWRVSRHAVTAGEVAGSRHESGCNVIRIERILYRSARLAFLMMTGEWPLHQIDHVNHDNADDRWVNLREATPTQNTCNRRAPKHNATSIKGVMLNKRTGRFYSRICVDGKRYYLGTFSRAADAARAYSIAAERYHGAFACTTSVED